MYLILKENNNLSNIIIINNITKEKIYTENKIINNSVYINLNKLKKKKLEIYSNNSNNINIQVEINNKILYNKIKNRHFLFLDDDKLITENNIIKINNESKVKKYWRLYWNSLHYLSYIYPNNPNNNHKNQILKLIKKISIDGIICNICRNHFNEWLLKNNINNYLDNNLKLFFLKLHNDINLKKNKKIFTINELNNIYLNFNDNELLSYNIDIKQLFYNNEITKFPDIINNFIKKN